MGCSPWGRKESNTTEWLPFHFSLSCIGEGKGNPLQCSCLENPRDGGAWWAAVYGVAQSRTWLKRLSSSSSHLFTYHLLLLSHWNGKNELLRQFLTHKSENSYSFILFFFQFYSLHKSFVDLCPKTTEVYFSLKQSPWMSEGLSGTAVLHRIAQCHASKSICTSAFVKTEKEQERMTICH